jgi:Zn-dependent protease with chaperone function
MFAKPVSIVLVYVITVFNLAILAVPILSLIFPFIEFRGNSISIHSSILQQIYHLTSLLLFLTSFLMLGYLALDFLFGFSVRFSLKNCVRYEKIKDYDFLTELFDQVKNKFGEKSVKLYIKNTNEINAYAVSSLGSRAIVLTKGLINHYLVEFPDPKTFLYALRSVIGHEMSHLINKDFLPAFLIMINQKVTNLLSRALYLIFSLFARLISMIPQGFRYAKIMWKIYSLLHSLLTVFNRLVVYNVYEFLRRFISRSIEYRCDNQSAKAFGGKNMALALSKLGKSGYFTLFSTHPSTDSRIKKAQGVKISDNIIKPKFSDAAANYLSIMFLVIICLVFAKAAGIDLLVRDYIRDHEIIHRKLSLLWNLIRRAF